MNAKVTECARAAQPHLKSDAAPNSTHQHDDEHLTIHQKYVPGFSFLEKKCAKFLLAQIFFFVVRHFFPNLLTKSVYFTLQI